MNFFAIEAQHSDASGAVGKVTLQSLCLVALAGVAVASRENASRGVVTSEEVGGDKVNVNHCCMIYQFIHSADRPRQRDVPYCHGRRHALQIFLQAF